MEGCNHKWFFQPCYPNKNPYCSISFATTACYLLPLTMVWQALLLRNRIM